MSESRQSEPLAAVKTASYRAAFLYSLLITLIVGLICDPTRLHEWMLLSDQGMYITAARNLLDNGTIEFSNQPANSGLEGKRQFYYMPGYVLLLAGIYTVFGFGVLQSTIPSALLFLMSCMLTYHIGRKLYSDFVGWIALICFCSYPFLHQFTFVAMSEMAIIASLLLAYVVFLQLPIALQPWLGWMLLAFVFLFRETSAIVLVPMCATYWSQNGTGWGCWKGLFILGVSSLLVVVAIYLSPVSSTRDSLFYNLIVYENDPALIHAAAHGTGLQPEKGILLKKITERMQNQTRELMIVLKPNLRNLELLFILGASVLGLLLFAMKRDLFALSVAVSTMMTLLVILAVYVLGHIGKRHFLQLLPLACIVYGAILELVLQQHWKNRAIPILMAVLLPVMVFSVYRDWKMYHDHDVYNDAMLQIIEDLKIDQHTVILAPYQAVTSYGVKHFPVKSLAVAYSVEELKRLLATHSIKTILLPAGGPVALPDVTKLTKADLEGSGFRFVRTVEAIGNKYDIYLAK